MDITIGKKTILIMLRKIRIIFLIVGLCLCCFGTSPNVVRLGSVLVLGTILILPIMQAIERRKR